MEKYGYEKGTENGSQNLSQRKERATCSNRKMANYSKGRKEIDEIDSEMALVPELPKDFDDFVDREVLPQYLFYDAGRKVTKGYCNKRVLYTLQKRSENPEASLWGSGRMPILQASRYLQKPKERRKCPCKEACRLLQKNKEGICIPIFECTESDDRGEVDTGDDPDHI